MVSGALLALLVLPARVVLTDLPVLSDPRVGLVHKVRLVLPARVVLTDLPVLSDPRVGLVHKVRLVRRVTLGNVVLLVNVERLVLLALLDLLVSAVPLVREWITSGPSRWKV